MSIPNTSKWWMVLDVCPELARYYCSFLSWENRARFKIQKPAWGAHISVITNELPPKPEFWEKYSGVELEFQYNPVVETNGEYFWLPVVCEPALDMREELGLPRNTFYPLHLTIARIA